MAEDQVARYQNPDNDPRGPWKSADYTCRYTTAERSNLNYPIIQPNTGEVAAVTTAELDFFADWYDVASAAARSINQRQKDGRGGCNETKKGEFLRFMCDHAADIRKLMGMGRRYASYLNERSQQIVRMCNKGNYFVLAKIEAFCSKYL